MNNIKVAKELLKLAKQILSHDYQDDQQKNQKYFRQCMQCLKESFEIDELVYGVGDYPNIYFQDNCINYNVALGSTRGFRVSIQVYFKKGNKLEAINQIQNWEQDYNDYIFYVDINCYSQWDGDGFSSLESFKMKGLNNTKNKIDKLVKQITKKYNEITA